MSKKVDNVTVSTAERILALRINELGMPAERIHAIIAGKETDKWWLREVLKVAVHIVEENESLRYAIEDVTKRFECLKNEIMLDLKERAEEYYYEKGSLYIVPRQELLRYVCNYSTGQEYRKAYDELLAAEEEAERDDA